MEQLFLPRYTIGEDCLDHLEEIVRNYGNKVALIHGERAYAACKDKLDKALEGFDVVCNLVYGHEASYEHINELLANEKVQSCDVIVAAGGGKCLDVCKVVGDKLNKPVFTVATIASTCAAVTKISILHNPDGSFAEIYKLKKSPEHCFIDGSIIVKAPAKYFWAGMGDTMAKHVECEFSAKNDVLDFPSEYGRTISKLCFYPILEKGEKAYELVKQNQNSKEVEEVILAILIATGSVSLAVHPNYNSAVAHALYYGLTVREWMERKHLHGEIVSYGTLVQLMVDEQYEKLKLAYNFNKAVGLPVCLADLDLTRDDPLEDVLAATVVNQELEHVPYPITKEIVRNAIDKLEEYRG